MSSSLSYLYSVIEDDRIELHNSWLINADEMVEVVYKNTRDEENVQPNINMACFTSCWARLKLYQEEQEDLTILKPRFKKKMTRLDLIRIDFISTDVC